MGSFFSAEVIKNADNCSEDKKGSEEKKEGNTEKKTVRTSSPRVPNKTSHVYKRYAERKNKKKDF